MVINDNIKLIRELSGLTQAQFAALIKTNVSNLKTYENTDVRPKAFVIFNISTFAGITSEQLEKKKLKPEDINIDSSWSKKVDKVDNEDKDNELKSAYERLIDQIEARRRDLEKHYDDAMADKKELYKLLHDFRNSLEANLTVIQKNLGDNRDYLELLVKVVRTNDAEIMDGLDHLENQPVGTHRKKAGNKEIALTKALKNADKSADVHRQHK